MYLLASTSAVVECPRALVFDYATDLTHFAQWFPGVLEVKSRDELAHATVGKEYEETVLLPGRARQAITLRVAEAEPPRKFVTEGALPLLLPRMEIEFEDAGPHACRLHWRMFSRNTSLAARWTVLPLARLGMQKRADAAMRRLKRVLDAP